MIVTIEERARYAKEKPKGIIIEGFEIQEGRMVCFFRANIYTAWQLYKREVIEHDGKHYIKFAKRLVEVNPG